MSKGSKLRTRGVPRFGGSRLPIAHLHCLLIPLVIRRLPGELRNLDAQTLVIFITASHSTETAIEAMKMGANAHLFKPVEVTELRPLVERSLEISRLSRVPARLGSPPVNGGILTIDELVDGKLAARSQSVYEDAESEMDRFLLPRILERTGDNQLKAARVLGVSRGWLRKRLRKPGIVISSLVEAGNRRVLRLCALRLARPLSRFKPPWPQKRHGSA